MHENLLRFWNNRFAEIEYFDLEHVVTETEGIALYNEKIEVSNEQETCSKCRALLNGYKDSL